MLEETQLTLSDIYKSRVTFDEAKKMMEADEDKSADILSENQDLMGKLQWEVEKADITLAPVASETEESPFTSVEENKEVEKLEKKITSGLGSLRNINEKNFYQYVGDASLKMRDWNTLARVQPLIEASDKAKLENQKATLEMENLAFKSAMNLVDTGDLKGIPGMKAKGTRMLSELTGTYVPPNMTVKYDEQFNKFYEWIDPKTGETVSYAIITSGGKVSAKRMKSIPKGAPKATDLSTDLKEFETVFADELKAKDIKRGTKEYRELLKKWRESKKTPTESSYTVQQRIDDIRQEYNDLEQTYTFPFKRGVFGQIEFKSETERKRYNRFASNLQKARDKDMKAIRDGKAPTELKKLRTQYFTDIPATQEGAIPFDKWFEAARNAPENKGLSDEALREYYIQKYGVK
jgi:hypothetical protein